MPYALCTRLPACASGDWPLHVFGVFGVMSGILGAAAGQRGAGGKFRGVCQLAAKRVVATAVAAAAAAAVAAQCVQLHRAAQPGLSVYLSA
jgi:hypothetical protein